MRKKALITKIINKVSLKREILNHRYHTVRIPNTSKVLKFDSYYKTIELVEYFTENEGTMKMNWYTTINLSKLSKQELFSLYLNII